MTSVGTRMVGSRASFASAVEGHVPVVPVVLHLLERKPLPGVIGAPAHGERHAMGDAVGGESGRDIGRARAPVMAHDGKGLQLHRVSQVQYVLAESGELSV